MPSKLWTLSLLLIPLTYIATGLYLRLLTLGFIPPSPLPLIQGKDHHFISTAINCEDIHLHQPSGLLFSACQGVHGTRLGWFPPLTRFGEVDEAWRADGGIYVIDPKSFTSTRLTLIDFPELPFVTHGIDILQDPEDDLSIYIHAINHLPNPSYFYQNQSQNQQQEQTSKPAEKAQSQIEILHHTLHTSQARYIRSILHPLIRTPNDIFSLGPGEMLVTNDHYYREGFMRSIEDIGSKTWMGWSDIVHIRAGIDSGSITATDSQLDSKQTDEGQTDRWEAIRDVQSKAVLDVEVEKVLTRLHNNNGLGHGINASSILISDASGGRAYLGELISSQSGGITINLKTEHLLPNIVDNPSYAPGIGLILPGVVRGGPHTMTPGSAPDVVVWLLTPPADDQRKEKGEGEWEKKVIFRDDGTWIDGASAAVLVPVHDPDENDEGMREGKAKEKGKGEGWLWVTGYDSEGVLAVKVDL